MSLPGSGRARLVDVARLAGVSPKTVSNVVNGTANVSEGLRTRVEDAIARLQYVPNTSGRTLRTGRTRVLALAVPDLSIPYFAELTREVAAAAEEYGYTILVDQTDGDLDRERQVAGGLRPQAMDGLIFSPLGMTTGEIAIAAGSTPMVLLGERDHPAGADHVVVDNVAAGQAATEHLLAQGRRRVALVGAPRDRRSGTGMLRVQGYRRALEAARLPVREELVVTTHRYVPEHGIAALEQLAALPEPPDAVFCCSDLLAIGLMHAARRHGLRVPEDLAVVGFDDIRDGRYSSPTLTTIAPDKSAIARSAVDLLVRRLRGEAGSDGVEVVVSHRLVVRESSGGAPPGRA
ncbi:LacI family DNA-binding transcriptional regulator [Phycicoccus flavus]|uniref:LacI family DNA-binding transcriptional regulator n=1 Tax=Phycicoccus flavus TaxID=2502783 RepID=UPI000FEC0909|nr:LacI family DNA-binding transcriptional regulator [Phycicoccus flavus]NHA67259.1 LacI family transcriptional regulator [Phycicoccus flavus]